MKKQVAIFTAAVMAAGACFAFAGCEETSSVTVEITAETAPETLHSDEVSGREWAQICTSFAATQREVFPAQEETETVAAQRSAEKGAMNFTMKTWSEQEIVCIAETASPMSIYIGMALKSQGTSTLRVAGDTWNTLSDAMMGFAMTTSPEDLLEVGDLQKTVSEMYLHLGEDRITEYLRAQDAQGVWSDWSGLSISDAWVDPDAFGDLMQSCTMPDFVYADLYDCFEYDQTRHSYVAKESELDKVSASYSAWMRDVLNRAMEQSFNNPILSTDFDSVADFCLTSLEIKINNGTVSYVAYEGSGKIVGQAAMTGSGWSATQQIVETAPVMKVAAMYYDWGTTQVQLPAGLQPAD